MKNVCPVINLVTKEQLIKEINELEVKADHYSRTDWIAYQRVTKQLKKLDHALLDIFNAENEAFLQSHKQIQ